ncbi:MAG: carboxypeptidase-like regulatory domain-containing protein [Methylotenera sp.]
MILRFASLLLTTLLTACMALPIAHDGWLTARHSGFVRDKTTGKPIAGAKIKLTSKYNASIVANTTSAADGSFDIGPVTRHERLYEVLPEPLEANCADSLDIEHPSYATERLQWEATASTTGGACRNIKAQHEIRLQKR